ncbi:ABC transporter ATP-binding protein [Desulfurobacterium atlanticum]|uniref:Peptide/nickel transport system ATP-binding protein n=1 Tax=Desulfurobacterium atlanticum TaxID=240169 RepID=A0A238YEB3_9BACT|nr:ABC transporter ATP-binding protein [Desulfurobacterium atlanticum]SNR69400.1 peptide/nickel transport system ATP-binding protein [Desulfurobacterium atlanticum]
MIKVEDLTIVYPNGFKAVQNVSFKIEEREVFALVGESGCGKSTTAHALIRLLPKGSRIYGKFFLKDREIFSLKESEMRQVRGKDIGMVFQDPLNALNPLVKIKDHFFEVFAAHKVKEKKEKLLERIKFLFDFIDLPFEKVNAFPFELSGGQRQRVMFALALVMNPSLLILDEPTTALDVLAQKKVLGLIEKTKREFNSAALIITHDMGVVNKVADKVAVMYKGMIMEMGNKDKILYEPIHPYTKLLISCVPKFDIHDLFIPEIPIEDRDVEGCPFAPRCPLAKERCFKEKPSIKEVAGRKVACFEV